MSDEAETPPTDKPAEPVVATPRRIAWPWFRRGSDARQRFKDLLVVFFGVYAAFLLNRFESDRRDTKRRTQILEALERETRLGIDETEQEIAQNEPLLVEFERRLEAGEMPGLGVSMNSSGYSATDDAALLQAGGLELLDVQTIELLRTVNGLQRSRMQARHNQFELSLAQLANHDPADFYDPATRRLKKRFAWWPVVQRMSINDARAVLEAERSLLDHIEAERGTVNPAPSPAAQTTPPRSQAASSPPA